MKYNYAIITHQCTGGQRKKGTVMTRSVAAYPQQIIHNLRLIPNAKHEFASKVSRRRSKRPVRHLQSQQSDTPQRRFRSIDRPLHSPDLDLGEFCKLQGRARRMEACASGFEFKCKFYGSRARFRVKGTMGKNRRDAISGGDLFCNLVFTGRMTEGVMSSVAPKVIL